MRRFLWVALAAFLASCLSSTMAEAQLADLPPPIQASPLLYASPYGPRYNQQKGLYQFHRGVDYLYGIGTPVYAVQGSTIADILNDPASGWYISIQGATDKYCGSPCYPQARFAYLHLFDNSWISQPGGSYGLAPDGNILYGTTTDNSTTETLTLENLVNSPPGQSCYAIIFWANLALDQPRKALSPCPGIPVGNPTFGIVTTNKVSQGNEIAVVGQSGAAEGHPHLHLQVNSGAENELLYVQHDNSNPPGYPIFISKDRGSDQATLDKNAVQLNGGEVLDPGHDSPLVIRTEVVYDRVGHDLDQAQIFMSENDTVVSLTSTCSPTGPGGVAAACFDYGGNPVGPEGPVARTVFPVAPQWIPRDEPLNTAIQQGVYPQIGMGGVVDFLTNPIDLTTLAPGSYFISVNAVDVLGDTLQQTPIEVIIPPELTVTFAGNGNGSVFSIPSGISCSSVTSPGCSIWFASYYPSVVVSLMASPSSGTTFNGWSGDCSGTNALTTILLTTESKNCTANFGGGSTYTYTGSPFTAVGLYYGILTTPCPCPPLSNISGSFTVPQPLPPNLGSPGPLTSSLVDITSSIVSFSFTDGRDVFNTLGNTRVLVATNASANITAWQISSSQKTVTGTASVCSGPGSGGGCGDGSGVPFQLYPLYYSIGLGTTNEWLYGVPSSLDSGSYCTQVPTLLNPSAPQYGDLSPSSDPCEASASATAWVSAVFSGGTWVRH